MPSPYPSALGAQLDQLHPRLADYVGELPPGHVGVGRGTFDVVGTPRRWLHPVLRLLEREGILVATWSRDVPFQVRNRRPTSRHLSLARRTLELPDRSWTMVDAIGVAGREGARHLVDDLGRSRVIRAAFESRVVDGALVLRSTAVGIRLGPVRLRVPNAVAPVVDLVERFDDAVGRQHVRVVLTAPLIGRLYEYAGHFDYEIVRES